MASAMPVLPEVESRMVFPGTSRPRASPSSIILRAGRSFTEPPGLKPSSLPRMRAPGAPTPPAPPVYLRSGVGTLTCTMMTVPPSGCQSDRARRAGGVQASVQLVEVGEPRRDAGRLLDRVEHRLERLVAVARDADDGRLVTGDPPLLDQLLGDRDRRAVRRLGEDVLRSGHEPA